MVKIRLLSKPGMSSFKNFRLLNGFYFGQERILSPDFSLDPIKASLEFRF